MTRLGRENVCINVYISAVVIQQGSGLRCSIHRRHVNQCTYCCPMLDSNDVGLDEGKDKVAEARVRRTG